MWPASDVRESGEVLVAASARLADQEIDEAARWATQTYHVAVRTSSPRIRRHVLGLHPHRRAKGVREFDECPTEPAPEP